MIHFMDSISKSRYWLH